MLFLSFGQFRVTPVHVEQMAFEGRGLVGSGKRLVRWHADPAVLNPSLEGDLNWDPKETALQEPKTLKQDDGDRDPHESLFRLKLLRPPLCHELNPT